MNILHFIDSVGIYGKERVVLSLLKLGGQVLDVSANTTFKKEVVRMFDIDKAFDKESVLQLDKKTITKKNFDIFHSHDFKSSVYALWYYFLCPKKPTLVRTLHGYTVVNKFSRKNLYRLIDKLLLRFFDVIVTVSPLDKNPKYECIPNGTEDLSSRENIENAFINSLNLPEFTKDSIIITSLGRLSKEKNYAALITALSLTNNKNIKLMICGEGIERKTLETLVQEYNLQDRVMLPGLISNPKVFLNYSDFYIQPSITEGLPLSVLESASLGKTLILSNVGGMTYLLSENAAHYTGISAESIADVLNKLITPNFTKRVDSISTQDRRTSDKARKLYQSKFTEDVMVESYKLLYNQLV